MSVKDNNNVEIERQALLKDLKCTVESLLSSQVANVWNVYGGLNRLHQAMEKIFRHQCIVYFTSQDNPDIIMFIQGLDWLQPNSLSITNDCVYQPHMPIHIKNDKASIWLYRSLENHTLSQKLSWLISDKEHLLLCYDPSAFLCQEIFCEATLICLRAIEQYQPSLLSEINPTLFLTNFEILNKQTRSHRRSSSFPNVGSWIRKSQPEIAKEIEEIDEVQQVKVDEKMDKTVGKLKPWNSLVDLKIDESEVKERRATVTCKSIPNTPMHGRVEGGSDDLLEERKLFSPSVLLVDYSKIHHCGDHPGSGSINIDYKMDNSSQMIYVENEKSPERVSHMEKASKSSESNYSDIFSIGSMPIRKIRNIISGSYDPEYSRSFMSLDVQSGQKGLNLFPTKSFLEDGGSSITPMANGYFPRPVQGQSLTSFLSSGQFSHTSAELDRENAHFSISEAMISAIEQVKFNKHIKEHYPARPNYGSENDGADESNGESANTGQSQRIRIRRKHKLKRKKLFDETISDTVTLTPRSTPKNSDTEQEFPSDIEDLEIESASNIADSRSLSLASLYTNSDVLKRPREAPDGQSDCVLSAEGVALSLISKFKPKQLPKASDLKWLVSELDVQQQLLPLPTSWPINPDGSVSPPDHITPLRGTADWAPPRAQIIFTPHPVPKLHDLMAKQNYRCAGCGMRVAQQYASKFRYCEYLGRYFCTGCHYNQLAMIPGKILMKWDFSRYPVSNFSYRLLEQMSTDPLFNVADINPQLYRKNRQWERTKSLRLQLCYLKDFIMSCRFAEEVQHLLQNESTHMSTEPDNYSINDLCAVKKGDLLIRLKPMVETALLHVNNCDLCKARGFICEKCRSSEIIFPWQLTKVTRCSVCGCCYHQSCIQSVGVFSCKRCIRLRNRRGSSEDKTLTSKPCNHQTSAQPTYSYRSLTICSPPK